MEQPGEPRNAWSVSLLFRLWSRFYDHPLPQRLYYRRVHRRILGRWRPGARERVLDVGCGTGLFLKALAEEFDGLALSGVDLSPAMLAQARRSMPDATRAPTFVEGSVYALPFADASFDVVLNTISCHFYLEQTRAFREIARVLRPGGRFFCAALSFGVTTSNVAGVAVYHPPRIVERHLRDAGFALVAKERILPGTMLFELRKP